MRRNRVMMVLIPLLLPLVASLSSCSPIGPAVIGIIAAAAAPGKSDKPPEPVLPDQASNPSPLHGASGVPVTTNLAWSTAANADSYNIYFGTSATAVDNADTSSAVYLGSQVASFFDPAPGGNLSYGSTYYWRVDAINAAGTTRGELWGFATEGAPAAPPGKVQNPTPADGATGVPISQYLAWDAATGAASYDVYFGITAISVANATTASAEFKGSRTALTYNPGSLSSSTTYYWRIDSVNAVGTTKGDLWSFTTVAGTFIYVDGASGDDASSGLTWATAVKTIQRGLDLAGTSGWTVLVANGTYSGPGNRELNFNGKAIHLKSAGGTANCFIDCGTAGRAFHFRSGESADSIIEGFTIINGR